jgi:ArsR family transcriptional regulator
MDMSETFRTLGDETRLRILSLISGHELCVCIIKEALDLLQPNVSKHLSRLKSAGIIDCRKVSQWCFFSISEDFKAKYVRLYEFLKDEWAKEGQYAEDLIKLESLMQTSDCCEKLLEKAKKCAKVADKGP